MTVPLGPETELNSARNMICKVKISVQVKISVKVTLENVRAKSTPKSCKTSKLSMASSNFCNLSRDE